MIEGAFADNPEAVCETLARQLHGRVVPDDAEQRRSAAQRDFDAAKKAVKDKRDAVKKRGLRGRDRRSAIELEIRPLEGELPREREAWLEALKNAVQRPELAIAKHIDCDDDEYRTHAVGFLADAEYGRRETVDLIAAFGSDACVERSGRITATPFCFFTGSGHQYFLDPVRQLLEVVSPERIREALFEPWTYRDEKLSLRWDPSEDRRYALMDRDPRRRQQARTTWMANLLAYRSLVLFPSAPQRKRLGTAGWSYLSDGPAFTAHMAQAHGSRCGTHFIALFRAAFGPAVAGGSCSSRSRGCFPRAAPSGRQAPLHKINFSPARGG